MSYLVANGAYLGRGPDFVKGSAAEYAVKKDILDSVMLIVPTGRYARKLKNDIIRQYYGLYGKPLGRLNVMTLQGLGSEFFKRINATVKKTLVSDSYQLALFEEAAAAAGLKYFSRKDGSLSVHVLKRLASVVNGLKEDGVRCSDLEKDLSDPDEGIDYPKLRDIYALYRAYQDILGTKYTDNYDLFNLINNYLRGRQSNPLPDSRLPGTDEIFAGTELIYVDGFTEFKPPEAEFLLSFTDSRIPLAIEFDYSADNGPLFSNLEYNIVRLVNGGLTLFEKPSGNGLFEKPDATPSGFLCRYLFNKESGTVKNKSIGDSIRIMAAKDKVNEVHAICRLIKHLCLEKAVNPWDICVAARQPENYAALFREMMPEYNIPHNISQRYELSGSPVVAALFSVLDIIIKGYRTADIRRAGKSSYLTFSYLTDGGRQEIDFDNLLDKASRLRIAGGRNRGGAYYWKNRLDKTVGYLHARLSEYRETGDADQMEFENLKRDLKETQKAAAEFKKLTEMMPLLQGTVTAFEFENLVKTGIIGNFRVWDTIENLLRSCSSEAAKRPKLKQVFLMEKIERDSRSLAEFLRVLADFTFILEDRYPGRKYKPEDLVSRLKTTVTGQKYQIKEKGKFGVTFTSIEQTRGMDYSVMILCGAIDGQFPYSYMPEVFLGKELPDTEERYLQSERLQFYRFLVENRSLFDNGGKKIYITYPKYRDGEELIRSPFIDALLKITDNPSRCFVDLTGQEKVGTNAEEFRWYGSVAYYRDLHRLMAEKVKTGAVVENGNLTPTERFIAGYHPKKHEFGEQYKGIIGKGSGSGNTQTVFESLKERAYSVSELEEYADCAFKYFARYILKLRQEDEPEEFLSNLETGNLVHYILYRFLKETQKEQLENGTAGFTLETEGLPVIGQVILNRNSYSHYLDRLKKIAGEELDMIRFDHPFFAIEEKKIIGSSHIPGVLEKWLDAELSKPDWGFHPVLMELSFGNPARRKPDSIRSEELAAVLLDEGLKIRGKSDRIELKVTEEGVMLMIADYKAKLKSGSSFNEIISGRAFQMPLYLLAVGRIMEHYYKLPSVPAGVIYYTYNPEYDKSTDSYNYSELPFFTLESGIVTGKSVQKPKGMNTENALNLLEDSKGYAKGIINNITEGNYRPKAAEGGTCKFCPYSGICRIKDNDAL